MNFLSRPLPFTPTAAGVARAGVALLLLAAAASAMAQYKIVGPDGKVTYTDKPPTAADQRNAGNAAAGGGAGGGGGGGALPYETRQATSRYPVALYAQKGCGPCDQARQALKDRGIPFSEYSVETGPDMTLLKQRFNDVTLPVITIGSQTIKGFLNSDLQSYADAAGYPKQARLSAAAWPAPIPLAPPVATHSATTAPSSTPVPSNRIDLPKPSQNGIQF